MEKEGAGWLALLKWGSHRVRTFEAESYGPVIVLLKRPFM